MILIQSQLCSIDQSDLFIPRSGKKSIQHLLLFFFFSHSALLFLAYISSTGSSCSLRMCVYNIYQAKCCLSNRLTPAQKTISSCPTRLILLFTSMLYFSLCLFVFFASHLCPPPPPPRLVSCRTPQPC